MILRRFYDEGLAQASYLVGCSATGTALIVDPNRAVQTYIDAARAEGLRITHVTETHIHADFLSGLRQLCAETGATPCLSAEGGTDWQYGFVKSDNAMLLHDGDHLMIGNVRIDVIHTPGHTPEHLTFLVTDTAGADAPMGAFTGDFIFAGDVGRPDLLEKAAGVAGTMRDGAVQLYRSLQRFSKYDDYLQLWPGHGAGSACGKALGAVPQTTLGYERRFNWAFSQANEESFVAAVLEGQPDPPKYFATMKRMNREGPALLPDREPPVRTAVPAGLIVDTRPWAEYAKEHLVGSINIPFNRSFTTWAGWMVPYDPDFHLLVADANNAKPVVDRLRMIGLDRVAGILGDWAASDPRMSTRSAETDVDAMEAALEDHGVIILDVRNDDEWSAGHVPTDRNAEVIHIPAGHVAERKSEIPLHARKIFVHCKAGSRSAIATSMLHRLGYTQAINVAGGFDRWIQRGHPVERGENAPAQTPH